MVSTNKNYFLLFTNTAQFIQEPLTLRLNIFSTAEEMCMCNSSLCCWWSFWMVVLVVLLFHHHYFKWIFSCQLIRFFFCCWKKMLFEWLSLLQVRDDLSEFENNSKKHHRPYFVYISLALFSLFFSYLQFYSIYIN